VIRLLAEPTEEMFVIGAPGLSINLNEQEPFRYQSWGIRFALVNGYPDTDEVGGGER
jgi:hypothetical protein